MSDVRPGIAPLAERPSSIVTSVPSSYLGYPLAISQREIVVFAPTGRRICSAASVKQARLLIRAYRRGA